jgi:hypothetical protein
VSDVNNCTMRVGLMDIRQVPERHIQQSGETLPFVEVPEFEAFGESARLQSKATIMSTL